MLNETFRDYIAELGNQPFIHEHLIKFTLFGIYQKASHCLIQIAKNFLKISVQSPLKSLVENLEEAMKVAVADLQSHNWTLDR